MSVKEKYISMINEIPVKYDNPDMLYREDIFVRRGVNSWISDAVALKIERDIARVIDSVVTNTRKATYNVPHPEDYVSKSPRSREKVLAIWLCKEKVDLGSLGKCISYEIPLCDKRSDNNGKIDLLSYNAREKSLYLIELKNPENTESLNRAILEISTYYQIIDGKKLLTDMGLPEDTIIKKAVLIHENSAAKRDYSEIKGRIADLLSVSIWTYDMDAIGYTPESMPSAGSIVTKKIH
jgi:hypothetical protein